MSSTISSVIVIPARMHSNRLPGKPLLETLCKSLLQYTYDAAKRTCTKMVMVASSDDEIIDHCEERGMNYTRTVKSHLTGTSRCLEFVESLPRFPDVLINWQCDEPLIDPAWVNVLIDQVSRRYSIATLIAGFSKSSVERISDRNTVKVAANDNQCFWFSRSPMGGSSIHSGVYGFQGRSLIDVQRAHPTRLSHYEQLEQLAWIEAGLRITPIFMEDSPLSINTPEDWEKFVQIQTELANQ